MMPQVTTEPTNAHVFVYGTLRCGQANDITRLEPPPVYVGPAVVRGTLFHLGAYPGLLLGPGGDVHGEVYAISPELEVQLDEIEELYPQQTDEYRKRRIPVLVRERPIVCLVYEINPAYVVGKPVLTGGDWVFRQ